MKNNYKKSLNLLIGEIISKNSEFSEKKIPKIERKNYRCPQGN